MKVALCLYGRYNNRYSTSSGNDGTEYIYSNIISKLNYKNIDVFIHSSDLDNAGKIEVSYKNILQKAVFEKKDFSGEILANGVDESIFHAIGGRNVNSLASFLYSRSAAINLKREYEVSNNFIYDAVVVCRFDLGQIDRYNGFYNHPFKVSQINFLPSVDMSYIYSAYYEQLNQGFPDQWFYGGSDKINKLSLMYERFFAYCKVGSSYVNTMTSGWFDSDIDDVFSNEMLKSKEFKSDNLLKFELKDCLNIHTLHKYFFKDVNLYDCIRFI